MRRHGTETMAISGYLREYATRVAGLLGDEVEASITIREHGLTLRGGSSTTGAARCDRAEAMVGDGPCVEAMRTVKILSVPALSAERRWQAWCAQTVREGFVKALALPAEVAPGIVIALNLYSRTAVAWEEETVLAGDSSAQLIAAGVRLQLNFADLEDAAGMLYKTVSDSIAVERGVGAIMQMNGCSEPEARDLLRAAAAGRNVPEREIAVSVLRSLALGGRDSGTDESAADRWDPDWSSE